MNRAIQVEVKSNYGNEAIYVVSEHRDTLHALTGRKTVTRADIICLQQLGFTIEFVYPNIDKLRQAIRDDRRY